MQVLIFDMVNALSTAMDLISPAVVNHHKRTALVAGVIARQMGLPGPEIDDIILAAMLHDGGALSLRDKLDALQFEADGMAHAEMGRRLIARLDGCGQLAALVKHHHTAFADSGRFDPPPPPGAHILHVADRVEVLLHRPWPLPDLLADVAARLQAKSGSLFAPEVVEAWLDAAARPEVQAGLTAGQGFKPFLLRLGHALDSRTLDLDGVSRFSEVFSQIIDFRSRFTATHSRGVAATSTALARLMSFSAEDMRLIGVAGNLHDLGKLAVPAELIDKPGQLTPEEMDKVRYHARVGYDILAAVPGLGHLAAWAGLHHERPNGHGYPFGMSSPELDLGARIIATADIFTAITEDRPYRAGMAEAQSRPLLAQLSADNSVDPDVAETLQANWADVDAIRRAAQAEAQAGYADFYRA